MEKEVGRGVWQSISKYIWKAWSTDTREWVKVHLAKTKGSHKEKRLAKFLLWPGVVEELQWRLKNFVVADGRSMLNVEPDLFYLSDWSEAGFGGMLILPPRVELPIGVKRAKRFQTSDILSQQMQNIATIVPVRGRDPTLVLRVHAFTSEHNRRTMHNNMGELKGQIATAEAAVETLDLRNIILGGVGDNTTAMAYLNNHGGRLHAYAKEAAIFLRRLYERNIFHLSRHIQGEANVYTDFDSRQLSAPHHWCLNAKIFAKIDRMFKGHTIDLFANRYNTRVHRFIAFQLDSLAIGFDAFQHRIDREENPYAFPPPKYIPRLCAQICQQQVKVITVIVPITWKRVWFIVAVRMSCQLPCFLPPEEQRLFHIPAKAVTEASGFPVTSKYDWIALRLSGEDSRIERFRTGCNISC